MSDEATILVVDDNAENRALAEATLEDEGYQVRLAASGAEALAAFEEHGAQCIILDVRMPEMDGFEVAERIRKMPEGRDVGILFLTALRDVDTFDAAQSAGADDFLTKPVRPGELISRVAAMLKLGHLDAERREQARLIAKQRDDLMRLQLQKERLTAFLVHDLKNPVNAMDLYAQLLLRNQALPDEARQIAVDMRGETRRMMQLIANLLDLSKSDEGTLEPKREAVDLPVLVRDVLDEQRANAASNDVALKADVSVPSARLDPGMFRRVIVNLVDNAIRHSPRNTEVIVRAAVEEEALVVRVADEGEGIPEEMHERIFDAHTRVAGGGHASRAGHGLGLAFCRAAVVAHAGTIEVEPVEQGTTILIRLPRHA